MHMTTDNVEDILADEGLLQKFAELNSIGIEAARLLLERVAERPELEPELSEYIFSRERSDDFKGYVAGEGKGFVRGHEAGFAKGALLGCLVGGCLVLGAFVYFKRG